MTMKKYVNGELVDLTLEEEAKRISELPLYEEVVLNKTQIMEDDLDLFVDDVARAKGYGTATMSPTAACMTYAGYPNEYEQDAIAFGKWKASIWPIVFQIQADFLYGYIPEPTLEEIIAQLPMMVWP